MGFCLDPSDCNLRINGLSVGHFRGYPSAQGWSQGLPIRLTVDIISQKISKNQKHSKYNFLLYIYLEHYMFGGLKKWQYHLGRV